MCESFYQGLVGGGPSYFNLFFCQRHYQVLLHRLAKSRPGHFLAASRDFLFGRLDYLLQSLQHSCQALMRSSSAAAFLFRQRCAFPDISLSKAARGLDSISARRRLASSLGCSCFSHGLLDGSCACLEEIAGQILFRRPDNDSGGMMAKLIATQSQ